MANAGIGVPVSINLHKDYGVSVPSYKPWSNALNDEPGLVSGPNSMATGNLTGFYFYVEGGEPISFVSVIGYSGDLHFTLQSYSSFSDMDGNINPVMVTPYTGGLSLNRSGLKKHLSVFAPNARRHYRLVIKSLAESQPVDPWRVLVGKWVEPDDNIEVGPSVRVDDRQNRRYAFTGRRNFVDAGVYPAFSGKWPWIDRESFEQDFRPMVLKYGASRPMVFCLDREDTDWGEDGLYYGDLEKDLSITLDDAELHEFSFSIVDIAPVVSS